MKLKTEWRQFPEEVRAHLAKRLLDRSITTDDLSKLKFWIESDPDVPEEAWYKDSEPLSRMPAAHSYSLS